MNKASYRQNESTAKDANGANTQDEVLPEI
jgi:hypothetical protein